MLKTRDFHGRLLISNTDGKKLGAVDDVYFDKEVRNIVAVYLGKSGIIDRKALMIDIAYVQLIGVDAWLISGSDKVTVMEKGPDQTSFVLGSSIRNKEVQSEGGTRIGVIGDIIVDEKCKVLGFAFDIVMVEGPLSEAKTIARDAITSIGEEGAPMITVLEQAEKLKL